MSQKSKNSRLFGESPLVHARVTGITGLVVLVSGSFATSVGSKLIVRTDVVATSNQIIASEPLFRLGILGSLVMMISWLFYALLLYMLLRRVDRRQAIIMLALVAASVPIYMLNQINLFAALPLAAGEQYEQVGLFLDLYTFGNSIAAIFFGLWLFPLGLLVFRSQFLPRILGILLMVGTLGYLTLFIRVFLFPGSGGALWSNPFLVITHVSELALLLWLLFRGVNVEQWEKRNLESASS